MRLRQFMETLEGPDFGETGWRHIDSIARVTGKLTVRNHNLLIGVTGMTSAKLIPEPDAGMGKPSREYFVTTAKQNELDEYIHTQTIIEPRNVHLNDGHLLLVLGDSQLTRAGDAITLSQSGLLYPSYLTPEAMASEEPARPIPFEVGLHDYFDKIT